MKVKTIPRVTWKLQPFCPRLPSYLSISLSLTQTVFTQTSGLLLRSNLAIITPAQNNMHPSFLWLTPIIRMCHWKHGVLLGQWLMFPQSLGPLEDQGFTAVPEPSELLSIYELPWVCTEIYDSPSGVVGVGHCCCRMIVMGRIMEIDACLKGVGCIISCAFICWCKDTVRIGIWMFDTACINWRFSEICFYLNYCLFFFNQC